MCVLTGCCGTSRSSSRGVTSNVREYAGDLLLACPGTGCLGHPTMSATRAADHLASSGFLRTVATRNRPTMGPMRCSPDLMSKPNHRPSSQTPNFPWCKFGVGYLEHDDLAKLSELCIGSSTLHKLKRCTSARTYAASGNGTFRVPDQPRDHRAVQFDRHCEAML